MKIRKANKKDFPSVARIFKEEFSVPPYKDKWTNKTALYCINHYQKIKSNIYVCVLGKQIIGFLISREEPQDRGILVVIEYFAVKKDMKKKGVGTLLLKKLEEDSKKKKAKAIYFNVVKTSLATKFYKKRGYTPSKRIISLGKDLK